jgi:hypothetical protein
LAIADGDVDPRVVLVDDAPRADVEVPDFGVPHLAFRQADAKLRRIDGCVRARREQPAPVRCVGARDRVVGSIVAATETVEDQQDDGAGRRAGSGDGRCRHR